MSSTPMVCMYLLKRQNVALLYQDKRRGDRQLKYQGLVLIPIILYPIFVVIFRYIVSTPSSWQIAVFVLLFSEASEGVPGCGIVAVVAGSALSRRVETTVVRR